MPNDAVSLFGPDTQRADARRRLAREELFDSQRGRLLQAIVNLSAEKGYACVTIADIVAAAAISRNAFYDHFSNKQECFLAALAIGGQLFVQEVLSVEPNPTDWHASTRDRVRAFLRNAETMPGLTRSLFLEAGAGGTDALRVVDQTLGTLAEALHHEQIRAAAHDPALSELPRTIFTALIGGITELVRHELLAGGGADLSHLDDDLVAFLTVVIESSPS